MHRTTQERKINYPQLWVLNGSSLNSGYGFNAISPGFLAWHSFCILDPVPLL